MSKPQNSFQTLLRPQKQPIRAQKIKNDPKIESNSNIRIEEIIKNENSSTTWVDLKTDMESYPCTFWQMQ